ncbi:MAG: hypothetical protein E7I37_11030 [Streptococcus mitis]|nr:hypothetical protein [Streptococcus mitis]
MEEEQLLKSGERINQLFSTDIKIIQNAIIAITLYRKLHHFIQKMQQYHMIVTIQIINDRLQ